MVKKILLLLLIFFSFFASPAYSQSAEELEKVISELSQKLAELNKQKNTLSNQIKIFDTQIAQTELKIKQTTSTIGILKNEIADLGVKIGDLDVSLNSLSAVYIQQVAQNYKLEKRLPFMGLLNFTSLNNFLQNYKYISVLQQNSQNTLVEMETNRTNMDLQKQAKAEKQEELESQEKKLAAQQKSLDEQKSSKNKLLVATKNDEKTYEKKLAEAQSQLNSLRRFSDSAGGSTCLDSSPGGGDDGNFYSQRDPIWCKKFIGNSSDTVGSVGCFISSVSMVYKKTGNSSMNPLVYASNSDNFFGNTAYMSTPVAPSGYTYRQVPFSVEVVDKELKSGRYVIAQMRAANIAGMHFIVLISGENGNYKIHDPWFGADQNFSSRYTPGGVMSLRLFTQ